MGLFQLTPAEVTTLKTSNRRNQNQNSAMPPSGGIFIFKLLDVLHLKYDVDVSCIYGIIALFQEERKGWIENELVASGFGGIEHD